MESDSTDPTSPYNGPSLGATILRDESPLECYLRSDCSFDGAYFLVLIRSSSQPAGTMATPTIDDARSTARRNSWPLGQGQPHVPRNSGSSLRVSASTADFDSRSDFISNTATTAKKKAMKLRLELERMPLGEEIRCVGAWAG
ncbi:hypothetical protein BFW01_g257 [Lasiodiplodia theobromae]|uniref:Uncharacterized protein n=1 Tax=Lasiodiplodia theobromae TaxID=45133 RepID=A0A5N5CUB8_9PEZI|nr:hypothetical protein DBV05_g12401 [Lasiodiplodia theobromae]KAF9630076.1 hypothetical protein BFW01_g257 [Lasiodiplodia theobromae]